MNKVYEAYLKHTIIVENCSTIVPEMVGLHTNHWYVKYELREYVLIFHSINIKNQSNFF